MKIGSIGSDNSLNRTRLSEKHEKAKGDGRSGMGRKENEKPKGTKEDVIKRKGEMEEEKITQIHSSPVYCSRSHPRTITRDRFASSSLHGVTGRAIGLRTGDSRPESSIHPTCDSKSLQSIGPA